MTLSSLWLPLSWSQSMCLAGCCGCILSLNKPQCLANPRLLPYVTAINLRPPGLLIHHVVGRCQTLLHTWFPVLRCTRCAVFCSICQIWQHTRLSVLHVSPQSRVSVCQTLPHTWCWVVYWGGGAATVHGYCRSVGLCAIWLWVSGFHCSGLGKSDASRNIKHLNWSLKGHSMVFTHHVVLFHREYWSSENSCILAMEDLCQVWQNNPDDVIEIGFGNYIFLTESLSFKQRKGCNC